MVRSMQVINGSAASGQVQGILGMSGIGSVAYTDASPTVPELFLPLAQAVNKVAINRFLPAEAIVMHLRRWNWMVSQLDSNLRPFVVPTAEGLHNALAIVTDVRAQGAVGQVVALPVYLDPNIPTNLRAGTEDAIIVGRFSDAMLFESSIRTRVLFDVLSGNLTARIQVYGYLAFAPHRYPPSFAKVYDTGLILPTGFN
jgi:hypothetical protein